MIKKFLIKQDGCIDKGCSLDWENKEYKNFDDFLKTLSHRKRKKIRQERKRVDGYNLKILRKLGANISEEDLCFMYECYCQTYALHHFITLPNKRFFYYIA